MKLRPHHLVCSQGYEGKGYSEEFIKHMNEITNIMKYSKNLTVQIVLSTDDICFYCPNMLGTGLCKKDEEVKAHDKKVFDILELEEKEYSYSDLVEIMRKKLDAAAINYICGDCMWLPVTNCRKLVVNFLNAEN